MATTDFSNWDFHNFNVQQELTGGQFVNAESTLIAAGPPTISGTNAGGQTNGLTRVSRYSAKQAASENF